MKSWLKGGLWFAGVLGSLILIGLLFQSTPLEILGTLGIPGLAPTLLINNWLGGTMKQPILPDLVMIFLTFIFSVVIYFIIGAIIGWIIEKVKAGKK
jgi:hypothetical protein